MNIYKMLLNKKILIGISILNRSFLYESNETIDFFFTQNHNEIDAGTVYNDTNTKYNQVPNCDIVWSFVV